MEVPKLDDEDVEDLVKHRTANCKKLKNRFLTRQLQREVSPNPRPRSASSKALKGSLFPSAERRR